MTAIEADDTTLQVHDSGYDGNAAGLISANSNTVTASMMSNMVSHYETGVGNPLNAYAMIGVLQEIDAYADNFKRVDPNNAGRRIFYRRLDRL